MISSDLLSLENETTNIGIGPLNLSLKTAKTFVAKNMFLDENFLSYKVIHMFVNTDKTNCKYTRPFLHVYMKACSVD